MKISIITASYNYANYIAETIQSVINQTYSDWELIIVDDCSSDNSVEVINSFKDERIRFFVNDKNLGLKETLKRGIQEATGDWVAFLESDDLWMPNCLQKKADVIKNYPNIALVFNDVETFGEASANREKNELLFKKSAEYLKNKEYPRNMFYDLGVMNRILTFSTVIVKKEELMKCDFDTPIDKFLDWWLFIHLARNNQFYYIPEKLTKWRIHTASYINKKNEKFSLPMSIYAIFDIIKKEKNIFLTLFLLLTIVELLPRIKARVLRALKLKILKLVQA